MLMIRLRRMGTKKRPFYRVVVTDSRTARDSRAVEVLGHYDPTTQPESFDIDRERLAHWVQAGARPSDTVRTLADRLARRPSEPATEQPAVQPAAVVVTPAVSTEPPAAEAPTESPAS